MRADGLQLLKRTPGKKESREGWEICTMSRSQSKLPGAANGSYQIAGVPAGDHTLTASAAGFVSDSQLVAVEENTTTTDEAE